MRHQDLLRLCILAASLSTVGAVNAQVPPAPAVPGPRTEAVPTTPSPPAAGSTGIDRGLGTGASAKPGSAAAMANVDAPFVRDATQANKAEVALGELAQSNAESPAVKSFGQKMFADHTKAYDELAKIASGKGVTVATEPTAAQKRTADRLRKLSGSAFDREFAKVMVADHKKAVSLFRNEASNGRDADLKAFATATLPTLEEHGAMAQRLAAGPEARM